MKFQVKNLLTLFVAVSFAVACMQSSKKSNDQAAELDKLEKEEIMENLQEVTFPLPEPFEVFKMLNEIGATWLGEVMNPVANADKYFTQKSKAVNIGVFASDLGYAATYNNQAEIKSYSKILKSLIDDLGVQIDYSSLKESASKENFSSKDSLILFVTNIFYDTYNFLYKESTPSLAGLMAAGAWVEGLYIATHISDDTYNNYDIVKIIYEQGKSLDNLIELLSKFKGDEMIDSLSGAFTKLKALYDSTDGSLTEEQLKFISTTIEDIRASMIS